MKTILIIQTLIIILGGFYIYTLTNEDKEQTVRIVEPMPTATTTTEIVTPPVEEIEIKEEEATIKEDLDGPHDQGMEWPTLEENYQAI